MYKFRLSKESYKEKPDSAGYDRLSFIEMESESPDKLYNGLIEGHTYSPIFSDFSWKKDKFLFSQFIFLDIDDSDISLSDFLFSHYGDCTDLTASFLSESYPPTFAYESFNNLKKVGSDGKLKYRFRLVWALSKPLNKQQYTQAFDFIVKDSNIDNYDKHSREYFRMYYGTNGFGTYFGHIYEPEQFIPSYKEDVVFAFLGSKTTHFTDENIPAEVTSDLKTMNTNDCIKKYTGYTLSELLISKPNFTFKGVQLWLKSDFKQITVPFGMKIKDGSKRRWKFTMMLYQVKALHPDFKLYQLFVVGVGISNFYFEHNREFGNLKSILSIVKKVYSDNSTRDIQWYSQTKTKGNYIIRGLNNASLFGEAISRSQIIALFERANMEEESGSAKNETNLSLYIPYPILDKSAKNETTDTGKSRTTIWREKNKTKKKKKPTTLVEVEEMYKSGEISRRTYFRYKKKLTT